MSSAEAEAYRDAIAFARSLTSGDNLGATSILENTPVENFLDLPVALSWLLAAAVQRLADVEGTEAAAVWYALIETVERTENDD